MRCRCTNGDGDAFLLYVKWNTGMMPMGERNLCTSNWLPGVAALQHFSAHGSTQAVPCRVPPDRSSCHHLVACFPELGASEVLVDDGNHQLSSQRNESAKSGSQHTECVSYHPCSAILWARHRFGISSTVWPALCTGQCKAMMPRCVLR